MKKNTYAQEETNIDIEINDVAITENKETNGFWDEDIHVPMAYWIFTIVASFIAGIFLNIAVRHISLDQPIRVVDARNHMQYAEVYEYDINTNEYEYIGTEAKPNPAYNPDMIIHTEVTTLETESTTYRETETTTVVTETVPDYVLLGVFDTSGYVATGNPTASGVMPQINHTVAMNRTQMKELGIDYGTILYIENMGTFVVEDCGCPYNTIDIFCETVQECYDITSSGISVYIVTENK